MDELKIGNVSWIKWIISKVIKTELNKQLGVKADIKLNKVDVVFDEGKAHLHLDIDADMAKHELIKLVVKKLGVDDEEL